MNNCPQCSTPFESGALFCSKCGCALANSPATQPSCPICHREYPVGTKYCCLDGAKLVTLKNSTYKHRTCGTEYSRATRFSPKDGESTVNSVPQYQPKQKKRSSIPDSFVKAPLLRRFLASILDTIFFLLLATIPFMAMAAGIKPAEGISSVLLGLTLYFLPVGYFFVKDGLGEGQSWGKRLFGIKVIFLSDGTNCTWATSALRTIISTIIYMIPLIGIFIEPIMVLVSSDRRRIADLFTGTVVVKANACSNTQTRKQNQDENYGSHYMK